MIRRMFLEQVGFAALASLAAERAAEGQSRMSSSPAREAQHAPEPAYVIFCESGAVRAVNCATGKVDYRGQDARAVINQTLAGGLTPGRCWKETVVLKGLIELDLGPASWDPRRRSGIEVPNYTRLQIVGAIRLVDNANSAPKQVNYIITNQDHQCGRQIEIVGGQIDGNAANNQHGIYGIQVSGVTGVKVIGVFIHDCRETGVAFENVSRNCWAINNHVIGRKDLKLFWQDGLGNQFNCHNIFYIGNVAERCRFWGIYIEGGTDIVALGNICHGNGRDGIIVGSGAHPGHGISVIANTVYENDRHGIHAHSANVSRGLILGNIARSNNAAGKRFSGIAISSRDFIVQGNHCWDDRPKQQQEYGIGLLAGSEHCQVTGNNVRGNKFGGLLVQQGASDCVTRNNLGHSTESRGAARGESPIVVQHGLAGTPRVVQLTARGTEPVALSYEADEKEIRIHHNIEEAEAVWHAEL